MKRAVIRVDASVTMGTGHVMRCLTLAEELRFRGVFVSFICRAHEGNLISTIRERTFPTVALPSSEGASVRSGEKYESWLGAPYELDATQSIAALGRKIPEWLIVDHYGIDARWHQRLLPHASRLMVIDDLANRSYDCDMLLDQNFTLDGAARYSGRVPAACVLLTGPRYALLARNYAASASVMSQRSGPPRKILVFFGGSDPQNMTGTALEALARDTLNELEADVVVGANNPHRQLIETLARNRPRTRIYAPKRDLAGLMAEADLAVGAGGVTTWERMCIGLPAVVVSIADNQEPACEALARSNLIYYAGPSHSVGPVNLAELIQDVIKNVESLADLRVRNRELVDGFGAGQVSELMFPSRVEELKLVSAVQNVANVQESAGERNQPVDDILLEANGVPMGRMRYERRSENVCLEWTAEPYVAQRNWETSFLARGIKMIQAAAPAEFGKPSVSPFFARCNRHIQPAHKNRKRLSIVILSDADSWINEHIPGLLLRWINDDHSVLWTHDKDNLPGADFCFMLGCGQIVPASKLGRFRNCLVVHESDLPTGKGWSPLTWQILEGKHRIPVTLLEAAPKVDSGAIYAQEWLTFEGGELINELRAAVGKATTDLCERFILEYPEIAQNARQQVGEETVYSRRTQGDSQLDVSASIESQFELFRVVDNQRYPAFFELRGHRYNICITKETKP